MPKITMTYSNIPVDVNRSVETREGFCKKKKRNKEGNIPQSKVSESVVLVKIFFQPCQCFA